MATNIDQLTEWCKTASKILGKKSAGRLSLRTSESKELKKHSRTVATLLKKLDGYSDYAALHAKSFANFEKYSTEAREAASPTSKLSDKECGAKVHKLTVDMNQLAQELQTAANALDQELLHLATLSAKRGLYMKEYIKVRNAVELLKVTPKASAEKVVNRLAQVQAQAEQDSVTGYEVAVTQLGEVAAEITRAQKTAKQLRDQELVQWAKKPEAQAQLDTQKKAYEELSLLVGIDHILAQYKAVIERAEGFAKASNWTSLLEELAKIKKLPTAKDAQKENATQLLKLNELPDYRDGMTALATLRSKVIDSEFSALDAQFRAGVNRLLTATGGKGANDLKAATQVLKDRVVSVAQTNAELDKLGLSLGELKRELLLLAAPLDMTTVQIEVDNFEGLRRAKQLTLADATGQKLLGQLQATLPSKRAAKLRWDTEKAKASQLAEDLTALLVSPCVPVKQQVPAVASLVSTATVTALETDHDWTRLVAHLDQAKPRRDALQQQHDDYVALKAQRDQAGLEVRNAAKALTPLIDGLMGAINKAVKNQAERFDPTTGLNGRVEKAVGAWTRIEDSAADLAALSTGKAQALMELEAVRSAALEAATPKGVQSMISTKAHQKALVTFEQNWPDLQDLLTELQGIDNEIAAQLSAKARQLRSDANVDAVKALNAQSKLQQEVYAASAKVSGQRDTEQGKVVTLGAEVLAEITRARKASNNASGFKEAFDALTVEHGELMLLGASPHVDAIKEALAGLNVLKARATKFAPTTPGQGVSIDKVMIAQQGAAKLLADADKLLTQNSPKMLATLKQNLVLLKKATAAADPEDSMLKIAAFSKSVTDAETGAKKVIEIRTEYTALLTMVKAAYEVFKARKIAVTYAKALSARLDTVEAEGAVPEKLYAALVKLKTLETEIDDASLNLQVAMGKEGALLKQQHDDKAAKAEWERAIKVFESRQIVQARATVQSQGGDQALILELERMVGMARQSAKRGDHGEAMRQLALTIERTRQINADPYGPAIGSRNKLPKDAQVYREAVQAFKQSLDEVSAAAKVQIPNMQVAVAKRLNDMLIGVGAKFDENAFHGVIVPLAAQGIKDAQRRGYREEALTKVRAVQAMLGSNPQVQSLLKNPIAPTQVSLSYRRVESALSRLDANISRCCS